MHHAQRFIHVVKTQYCQNSFGFKTFKLSVSHLQILNSLILYRSEARITLNSKFDLL